MTNTNELETARCSGLSDLTGGLGGWISMAEMQPEMNTYSLVCGEKNTYYGFWNGVRWMVENRGLIHSAEDIEESFWMKPSAGTPVLFWMPLPKPPNDKLRGE